VYLALHYVVASKGVVVIVRPITTSSARPA